MLDRSIALRDFAVLHGIGLAVIFDFSVLVEVDLAVFAVPLAVLVLEDAGLLERDLTVGALPPAVLVLVDLLLFERDLTVGALPPAVFVLIDESVTPSSYLPAS